jgi:hypothetical protein
LGQKNEKAPADAAEAQKLQNKTNYGKNLEVGEEGTKVEKSNIVPEKIIFFLKGNQPFSASRAITSF